MNLVQRAYQPDDYWRIRAFLREVYLLNDRRELCWQTYRFDYWRWHGVENIDHFQLEDVIIVVGNTRPSGRGGAASRRARRSVSASASRLAHAELEEEMLAVAEEQLAHGQETLTVWCNEHDARAPRSIDQARLC